MKVVVPEPCTFFWIPGSIGEAAAIILNGAKIFLAKGANVLNNEPKHFRDWIILDICVLDNFISVDLFFQMHFLA